MLIRRGLAKEKTKDCHLLREQVVFRQLKENQRLWLGASVAIQGPDRKCEDEDIVDDTLYSGCFPT